jgi:Flp pilus assembly protein TadD
VAAFAATEPTKRPRATVIPPEKHLSYALGYLQLGLCGAAREELSALTPEFMVTPSALAVRLEVAMAEETWDEVIALAPELVGNDATQERPWIAWAYALRERERVAEAQEALLAGARLIKEPSPLVTYNLACYACLLGELDEARRLLAAVVARDKSWREISRGDPDLAPLFVRKK